MRSEDWVSCADRMPDVGQEVLVYNPDYDSGETYFWLAIYERDGTWNTETCTLNPEEVTHWMALHEPPGMEAVQ